MVLSHILLRHKKSGRIYFHYRCDMSELVSHSFIMRMVGEVGGNVWQTCHDQPLPWNKVNLVLTAAPMTINLCTGRKGSGE